MEITNHHWTAVTMVVNSYGNHQQMLKLVRGGLMGIGHWHNWGNFSPQNTDQLQREKY